MTHGGSSNASNAAPLGRSLTPPRKVGGKSSRLAFSVTGASTGASTGQYDSAELVAPHPSRLSTNRRSLPSIAKLREDTNRLQQAVGRRPDVASGRGNPPRNPAARLYSVETE